MKKTLEISLNEQSWSGVQALAEKYGISVSELLEKLGSGQLTIIDPEELEDRLDLQEALEILAEAKASEEEHILWEDFEAQLEKE